jgi:hypothetical protein
MVVFTIPRFLDTLYSFQLRKLQHVHRCDDLPRASVWCDRVLWPCSRVYPELSVQLDIDPPCRQIAARTLVRAVNDTWDSTLVPVRWRVNSRKHWSSRYLAWILIDGVLVA